MKIERIRLEQGDRIHVRLDCDEGGDGGGEVQIYGGVKCWRVWVEGERVEVGARDSATERMLDIKPKKEN